MPEAARLLPDLRASLGYTRAQFAAVYRLSYNAVWQWETGRRRPRGPELVLLTLIWRMPHMVELHLKDGLIGDASLEAAEDLGVA